MQLAPEVSIVTEDFMKNLEKEFNSSNQDVDLYEYYQALTLDTICRTALGVKYEIQNNIEHSEILRHVKVLFSNNMNVLTVLFGEFKTAQTSLTTPACTLMESLVLLN